MRPGHGIGAEALVHKVVVVALVAAASGKCRFARARCAETCSGKCRRRQQEPPGGGEWGSEWAVRSRLLIWEGWRLDGRGL